MAEHKGFDPSQKKIKEARKRGSLPKSVFLSQSLAFIAIFSSLFSMLQIKWSKIPQMVEYCLSIPDERLVGCSQIVLSKTLIIVFVALLISSIIATFVELLQVKFQICWEIISPKFERIDPVSGLKRVISNSKKVFYIFLKLTLIAFLIVSSLNDLFSNFKALIFDISGRSSLKAVSKICSLIYINGFLLFLFGCVEFYFNRRRFLNENSMTLDEVRREMKEEEGDRGTKAQRRSMHEAMAMAEIVKRVRASKVIIVD